MTPKNHNFPVVFALLWPLASLVFACKPPVKPDSEHLQGFVIGDNNITPVGASNASSGSPPTVGMRNAAVLIVNHTTGHAVHFCSGVVIASEHADSNKRILTNHHCFASTISAAGDVSKDLRLETCSLTEVYFHFEDKTFDQVAKSGCALGSLRTDNRLDLAVFTLSLPPPKDVESALIYPDDGSDLSGRAGIIVHHPDIAENYRNLPGSVTKMPIGVYTSKDCTVTGPFAPSEWSVDPATPFAVKHTCDILSGSSGSPLFDAATGAVMGVNWGGVEFSLDGDSKSTTNAATSAHFIHAFLEHNEQPVTERLGMTDTTNNEPTKTSWQQHLGAKAKVGGCVLQAR